MRNILFSVFILFFLFIFIPEGECSFESLIRDAIQKVENASHLVERAQERIRQQPTVENLQVALELYIEAGQLFEQAGKIMSALGPEYTNPEDLEGCAQALQSCLVAIEELKEKIRRMQYGY